MQKIRITDTSLRDGHQSLWATRMTTEDMLPILEKMDDVGYHSLEVWGGATFDVCIRFLHEDPWERLRIIRRHIKRTPLQMLLRGQSLVGYTHYPDDVVYRFVDKAAENGIDIFRTFDALNDLRNLASGLKAIKKTGKHAQACVVYTISPVHSAEHFVENAMRLRDMGADSICIKDMAGLLSPYVSYELVSALKEKVGLPIQLHTHYIGGLAVVSVIKAAEAGVDVVDTASVPMAFGSSQPPVETVVRALQGSGHDTGLNLHQLFEVAAYFEDLRQHKGFERGVTKISDMRVFEHQVPGGMISNLISQLEEQKAGNRLEEVLREIPRVREDMGYPPLVTPTSQIIGIQAVLNVLMGERYKLCPGEVKDYLRGYYGQPPAPVSEELRRKIIGDLPVITRRPADELEPRWDKAVAEMQGISDKDEDVLTYVMFPQVALKYFDYRAIVALEGDEFLSNAPELTAQDPGTENARRPVSVPRRKAVPGGEEEEMKIEDIRELIVMLEASSLAEIKVKSNDTEIVLRKSAGGSEAVGGIESAMAAAPRPEEGLVKVSSPMVGTFYASPSPEAPPFVAVGDKVKEGQTLCIVEAMKLMNEIKAECNGEIAEVLAENGQALEYGQVMFIIRPA
ncbi:MAG: acetyl-CoA carboxylase biotin carboxyl carrier protein [Syntrophomonadaceae bacterium]|nr:acetyl-CoA carboxylase biotin carboxyl carrier protein [Syntrophomonadaceae bacterium]